MSPKYKKCHSKPFKMTSNNSPLLADHSPLHRNLGSVTWTVLLWATCVPIASICFTCYHYFFTPKTPSSSCFLLWDFSELEVPFPVGALVSSKLCYLELNEILSDPKLCCSFNTFKKMKHRYSKDASLVKSIGYFCRGTRFSCQHLHGSSLSSKGSCILFWYL